MCNLMLTAWFDFDMISFLVAVKTWNRLAPITVKYLNFDMLISAKQEKLLALGLPLFRGSDMLCISLATTTASSQLQLVVSTAL
jgi:hypothetical protein